MTDTKPTPRTDAAVHPTMLVRRVDGGFVEAVEASFARTLERELDALKLELGQITGEIPYGN